jgi:hypothetical protein
MVNYLEIAKRVVNAQKGDEMKRKWKWSESEILAMVAEYKRLAGRVTDSDLITHKVLCRMAGAVLGLTEVSVEAALRNHVENKNYPPHCKDDDYVILKTWIVEREGGANPIPRENTLPWINPRVGDMLRLVEKKNEELEERNQNLRDQLASVEEAFDLYKRTAKNLEEKCERYDKHFDRMGAELELKKKQIRELEKKVKSLKSREFEIVNQLRQQVGDEEHFFEKFQAKYGAAAPGGGK